MEHEVDNYTKGLLKGLEDLEVGGQVETIQTTTLMRSARILRRVLETWGDLLSLKLQWKTLMNNNNNNNNNGSDSTTSILSLSFSLSHSPVHVTGIISAKLLSKGKG